MTQPRFDFVLFGSTLVARLVAFMLAGNHGQSVLLVGESQAQFRLPRHFDLSVTAATRPETWSLLEALVPETVRALSRIVRRRLIERTDTIMFADGAAAQEALGHIRHMALAFGQAVERLPASKTVPAREAALFRDVVHLRAAVLEPVLDGWLDQHGVRRVGRLDEFHCLPEGSGWAMLGGESITFGQSVVLDEDGLEEVLGDAAAPPTLTWRDGSTILAEPLPALPATLMVQVDTGLTVHQPRRGSVTALAPQPIDALHAELGRFVPNGMPVRPVGQSQYRLAAGIDGAPLIGHIGSGPQMLLGLGAIAAFLAPAIARSLIGRASALEQAWFAARDVHRLAEPSLVGDWTPS